MTKVICENDEIVAIYSYPRIEKYKPRNYLYGWD